LPRPAEPGTALLWFVRIVRFVRFVRFVRSVWSVWLRRPPARPNRTKRAQRRRDSPAGPGVAALTGTRRRQPCRLPQKGSRRAAWRAAADGAGAMTRNAAGQVRDSKSRLPTGRSLGRNRRALQELGVVRFQATRFQVTARRWAQHVT
jgi:hypothetical protein